MNEATGIQMVVASDHAQCQPNILVSPAPQWPDKSSEALSRVKPPTRVH
jgi:hypothetical protein